MAKRQPKQPLLTTPQLAARLGIKRSRLSQLISKGLPVAQRKTPKRGGRPSNHFDFAAVQTWMAANVRMDAVHSAAVSSGRGAERTIVKSAAKAESSSDKRPIELLASWDDTLTRARQAEQLAFGAYAHALRDRDVLGAASANKNWLATMDTLRKMEESAAKIQQQRRESIPLSEHERIYFEAHGKVANELKLAAKKITAMVVGKRRKTEVFAIVDGELRSAMRHLANELDTIERSQ